MRWNSSYINHFTQPDTIIPNLTSPQSWDRYAYVSNNPVKLVDPTGHKCSGEADECLDYDGKAINGSTDSKIQHERKKQNFLFQQIFRGSGSDGGWIAADWDYYYNHRDELWGYPNTWINPDRAKGWDLFALHVQRLASYYGNGQKDQFVRDFALVFAGTPSDEGFVSVAWDVRHGPVLPMLNYTNDGLNGKYLDSKSPDQNQSHHYAGIFLLSYFATPIVARGVNFGRDYDNVGDINLGNAASADAWTFHESNNIIDLVGMISALK